MRPTNSSAVSTTNLQTSQKENSNRIPFTLIFHPHNHAVKSIIQKNFKLLQNDPDTSRIFLQSPLISFKRDKNIGNFLVRSAFQTSEQPGTFKCARTRCKTCPFICNVEKLLGPKRSIKITDHFTCTSANVIYCITCTLCKKLFMPLFLHAEGTHPSAALPELCLLGNYKTHQMIGLIWLWAKAHSRFYSNIKFP